MHLFGVLLVTGMLVNFTVGVKRNRHCHDGVNERVHGV